MKWCNKTVSTHVRMIVVSLYSVWLQKHWYSPVPVDVMHCHVNTVNQYVESRQYITPFLCNVTQHLVTHYLVISK